MEVGRTGLTGLSAPPLVEWETTTDGEVALILPLRMEGLNVLDQISRLIDACKKNVQVYYISIRLGF